MDDREDALKRLREKRDAYVAIFGPPGQPTPFGKVVLDDLDAFCTTWRESVHMDANKRMDPYTTIYRDGKKAVTLRIYEMIKWRESDGRPNDSSSSSDPATGGSSSA